MITSAKKIGVYEKELLDTLALFFEHKGFKVHQHVQLNISWGNIISDVDLVIESENYLFGIEVKSKKDNLTKLVAQINRMFHYFDGVYVATDNPKWMSRKEFFDERIGILIINGLQVAEKACQFNQTNPDPSVMSNLRKICLTRLSTMVSGKSTGDKKTLIQSILKNSRPEHLRKMLKSIIICNHECQHNCPLWVIEKQWVAPIKKVHSIVVRYGANLGALPLLPADFDENSLPKESDGLDLTSVKSSKERNTPETNG